MNQNRSLTRRSFALRTGALAAAPLLPAICASSAFAQSAWPNKAVRMIVPYGPGGGNDIIARVVSEKLAPALGQPVVVENRAGAGAIVGTDHVAKSAPDGYTLAMTASGSLPFNQVLVAKLPYDPIKDFAPISIAGTFPLILCVNEQFPAKTLAELVAWTKNDANKAAYSYPAASFQLIMELVKQRTGLKALNVPYQGSAPSINAVMTQEVQMTLIDSGPVGSLLKAGKLRALAVTSAERMPSYPNVPTFKEQGIDLAVTLWTGLLAPAGTPAAVVKRLEDEMGRIMKMPDVVERLGKLDIKAIGSSSAEFTKTIADDIRLWSQVARDNNIKPT
jgi:tripartite-type tricarboxylate transporter receptor subunit TctC